MGSHVTKIYGTVQHKHDSEIFIGYLNCKTYCDFDWCDTGKLSKKGSSIQFNVCYNEETTKVFNIFQHETK